MCTCTQRLSEYYKAAVHEWRNMRALDIRCACVFKCCVSVCVPAVGFVCQRDAVYPSSPQAQCVHHWPNGQAIVSRERCACGKVSCDNPRFQGKWVWKCAIQMASGKNLYLMHTVARSRLRWLRYGDGSYREHIRRMRRKIFLPTKYSSKVKRARVSAVQRKQVPRKGDWAREAASPSLHSAPSKAVNKEGRPAALVVGRNDLFARNAAGVNSVYSDGSHSPSTTVCSSERVSQPTVRGKVQSRGGTMQDPTALPAKGALKGVYPMAAVDGDKLTASGFVGQCDHRKDKLVPLDRSKPSLLTRRLRSRVDAARFRWLNELLYTCTGSHAAGIFKGDPSLFDVYHKGFSEQVSQWPINPLDTVIRYIQGLPKDYVVADLGCGEGRLACSVPQMVHSFDLLSTKSHVTACDMAHLPLASSSVDVAVFCLSLMGTNLGDYVSEAWRALRLGGWLKIIEVVSRIENVGMFVKELERFGFALVGQRQLSKMFVDLELQKTERRDSRSAPSHLTLKPCLYKRR